MKKLGFFLVIGMLFLSVAVFAQTAQGAQTGQNAQDTANREEFARGGYKGPVLAPIGIADLLNTAPNEFVIVEGYLIQQRVPGTFVLADSANNPTISVVVRFNNYGWVNLDINPNIQVHVYGNVNRSDLRIEIEGTRIEIKQ